MTFLDLDRRSSRILSRTSYLSVVRAGLSVRNFRFAREAAIAWLSAFPGDLSMSLLYAQALIGEERLVQALPVLQGLCMADVEFLDAAQELYLLQNLLFDKKLAEPLDLPGNSGQILPNRKTVFAPGRAVQGYLFALTGSGEGEGLPTWATDLHLARYYLSQNQLNQAEQMIRQVLSMQNLHPLIAVTHLRYLDVNRSISNLESRQKSAARYTQTWPDCLCCSLYYADWMLERGDSTQAVAILHQTAARDVSGQVPSRIWGDSHPYLPLWPERMQLEFGQGIPADVAQVLGWNRLPSLVDRQTEKPAESLPQPLPWEDQADFWADKAETPEDSFTVASDERQPDSFLDLSFDSLFAQHLPSVEMPFTHQELAGINAILEEPQENAYPDFEPAPIQDSSQAELEPVSMDPKANAEDLLPLKQELDRMAKRLRLPGVARQDGRFPVYVILSTRKNLENQYGDQACQIILDEMEKLAAAVRLRKRWDARVFLVDDPENLASLSMEPVETATAWNIKLALADLDKALSKRGEMIGAVLIVGGPEIVPFHSLPNPVDDQDDDVPSDNPYGARDENYFMPEWPVGRLPGGGGSDAGLLIEVLRRLIKNHLKFSYSRPWYRRLADFLWNDGRRKKSSFGYTAAVWRNAAENVFRPIGEPKTLNSSPPLGLADLDGMTINKNGREKRIPKPQASLAYFNLHGMEHTAEWYGQRDPLDTLDGPDFPVALRPEDICPNGRYARKIPQVVFSEACYGLHIFGRSIDHAISLKFLEAGSLAVVGSTVMAYGSIDTPLVAADLLGYAFWKSYQEGLPVGEALRQAKIHLAKVMNTRQGYLDGEDQKTIISFVLYGDPLASREITLAQHKSIWRSVDTTPQPMTTVCDRSTEAGQAQDIPAEVIDSVRQVVSQYLPGMANAQMAYTIQRKACEGQGHACPTSEMKGNAQPDVSGVQSQKKSSVDTSTANVSPVRRLVTLSKQIPNSHGVHAQVARLTLDENGKLVKLVVSR